MDAEDFADISRDFNAKNNAYLESWDENWSVAKNDIVVHEWCKFKYDENGIPITLSEEDIRKKFPYTYQDVTEKAKTRYSNFKQGKTFNALMKQIKINEKLYYERKLDSQNPKSQKKGFYSSNIWQVLDNHYSRDRI